MSMYPSSIRLLGRPRFGVTFRGIHSFGGQILANRLGAIRIPQQYNEKNWNYNKKVVQRPSRIRLVFT